MTTVIIYKYLKGQKHSTKTVNSTERMSEQTKQTCTMQLIIGCLITGTCMYHTDALIIM